MIESLNNKKVLVTGGAGFIGSNLVEALLNLGAVVTVFDNLETGKLSNLTEFESNSNFTFIQGDLRNVEDCQKAVKGIDVISHQAALGSVPRSIEFPHNTHAVNATGFLNMLHAAKEEGIKRFVYASSSSVYGDSTISPKFIGSEGKLLSPYAVTKQLNEKYANVYTLLHQMETVGLRYFNVFGTKQDPHGVYAAAIPRFLEAMLSGGKITINGDGEQTRDFTYVKNAVKANILALSTENTDCFGKVYNVACGKYFTLNSVISSIQDILVEQNRFNPKTIIEHGPDRMGDIKHSLADISETINDLGYNDVYQFNDGIKEYLSQKD
jgi:nucleoside-diphosphate-sugar epimerase